MRLRPPKNWDNNEMTYSEFKEYALLHTCFWPQIDGHSETEEPVLNLFYRLIDSEGYTKAVNGMVSLYPTYYDYIVRKVFEHESYVHATNHLNKWIEDNKD